MTEPKGDRYVYVVEDFKVSKSDQVPRYIDLVIRSSQMTDDPASQSPGGRRAPQRVLGNVCSVSNSLTSRLTIWRTRF